ncbi:MAG: hypothetical protein D6744_03630 [Planctomycetota bacterium]|nr:MAG: hypothetical protein D6744_03630 [Planctomycetota bacterium]
MLGEQGYATGGFVSGVPLAEQSNFNLGFQTYDDTGRDGKRLIPKRRGDETITRALRWVRGLSPDRSMLLFVHLFETHNPYWTPADLTLPFEVDADLDAHLKAMGVADVEIADTTPVDILLDEHPLKTLAAAVNAYDNQVYLADHLVHRLLRELEAAGRLRDALVILTSDHGEGLGEHGLYSHGMHLYEEQIHIPLIAIRYGASWPAERVRRAVSILDIMPTVLDEAGIAAPKHIMGRSLSAAPSDERWLLMQRREFDQTNRKRRGAQFAPADPLRALRGDDRYKYLLTGDLHSPVVEELYDLESDPHEWRNIIDQQPQIARRLRTILTLRVEDYEAKAVESGGRQADAETEAAMKALGYAP